MVISPFVMFLYLHMIMNKSGYRWREGISRHNFKMETIIGGPISMEVYMEHFTGRTTIEDTILIIFEEEDMDTEEEIELEE